MSTFLKEICPRPEDHSAHQLLAIDPSQRMSSGSKCMPQKHAARTFHCKEKDVKVITSSSQNRKYSLVEFRAGVQGCAFFQ